MAEMDTAELSLVEKLARVPCEPGPVLAYSPKSTLLVRSSPAFQILQPALLTTELMAVL